MKYFIEGGGEAWRGPYRVWARAVQWLLDRHPTFSERFACYVVGGIDELHVMLEAVKGPPVTSDAR